MQMMVYLDLRTDHNNSHNTLKIVKETTFSADQVYLPGFLLKILLQPSEQK